MAHQNIAMQDQIPAHSSGRPSVPSLTPNAPPVWPAYFGAVVLALVAIGLTGMAPYTAPPVEGRATGVVFAPFGGSVENWNAIRAADPDASLLDVWYDGKVLFIRSESPDFIERLKQAGAIYSFDAVSAGCHIP